MEVNNENIMCIERYTLTEANQQVVELFCGSETLVIEAFLVPPITSGKYLFFLQLDALRFKPKYVTVAYAQDGSCTLDWEGSCWFQTLNGWIGLHLYRHGKNWSIRLSSKNSWMNGEYMWIPLNYSLPAYIRELEQKVEILQEMVTDLKVLVASMGMIKYRRFCRNTDVSTIEYSPISVCNIVSMETKLRKACIHP